MNANEVQAECTELKRFWNPRAEKFKDWYNIITLDDSDLKQEGMECVITNEPATFFNLALQLLTPDNIAHRIPVDTIDEDDMAAASEVEKYFGRKWHSLDVENTSKGRSGWLRELESFLIATGWYSVFSLVASDKIIAEVWNPADVFPDFDDSGMARCAHIYTISEAAASRKVISRVGWAKPTRPFVGNTTVWDYWRYNNNGIPWNLVVMGNELVRNSLEPGLKKLPIYCRPVAGLPDRGSITTGGDWKGQIGRGVVATNEGEYVNYNKQQTFQQQLLRDTAQPRWYEKSRSGGILREADIFKRGAIFRMTPEEDVGILPTAPLPLELRTQTMDAQSRLQRGSVPYALYGNVQQVISSVLMSQIASAALQILKPYHEATKSLMEELDNDWADAIKSGNSPDGFKWPRTLPRNVRLEVDYRIDIPGDMVSRVTAGRMLNPQFELSTTKVMDLLFPEITDPMRELARAASDRAQRHPVMESLALIRALQVNARILREAGDTEGAKLYEEAANMVKSGGEQPRPTAPKVKQPRQEVMPREAMGGEPTMEGI